VAGNAIITPFTIVIRKYSIAGYKTTNTRSSN